MRQLLFLFPDAAKRPSGRSADRGRAAGLSGLVEAFQVHRAAHRHGVGATASPLVCGHSAEHEALESEVASFLGTQAAVYFHSGYGTNAGIVSALILLRNPS